MAYKDSSEIAPNSNYALGDYSFRIERSSVPGSTNDKIEAICTDKDGKNARKSIQLPSTTKLDGYYVEANESEATVYAVVQVPTGDERESHIVDPFAFSSGPYTSTQHYYQDTYIYKYTCDGCVATSYEENTNAVMVFAADHPGATVVNTYQNVPKEPIIQRIYQVNIEYTYDEKTVYWNAIGTGVPTGHVFEPYDNPSCPKKKSDGTNAPSYDIAWAMIYGTPTGDEYEEKTMMVGRFAIDLEDAGGVGPGGGIGGGWTDPEDYDEGWEEGDPTHTLFVEVTGALSGRHNDPIEDPSYSYIPADKDTVNGYGCGGDGGNGGGGGAGASTVVVNKFATDLANYKEVTALARRHGYGSGGGKGGKGGDGCILVYY